MCSGVGLKPLSVNSDSYLTKKKERIKSQMKAKNCLLYLLQLCRLEFLLETLEVNLTLLFKVTFYYSQPFHKLPHSWDLEAQAGDNCDSQKTFGPERKIYFFISLKEWHPNDFCRKERDLNQHFNIRSNWYLCLNWISFKSQNMILHLNCATSDFK